MDPKLLANYKAKQADPVFIKHTDEEAEEASWGPRLALVAFVLLLAGFVAFFVFTSIKPIM